jgi:hypothetical protein
MGIHEIKASDYAMTWGSAKSARRVCGLSKQIREDIANGIQVVMIGCPTVRGCTLRVVRCIRGRYYTRMP